MPRAALEAGSLEILAATPRALRAMLSMLPPGVLKRPDSGGWSAHDIVAHLVDRGRIQRERVDRLLAQPGATIEDRDEQVSLEESGLRARGLADLLDSLERERANDVALYSRLRPFELEFRGVHSAAGEISVANVVNQAAYHDAMHIAQVAGAIGQSPAAGRGAFAMFG